MLTGDSQRANEGVGRPAAERGASQRASARAPGGFLAMQVRPVETDPSAPQARPPDRDVEQRGTGRFVNPSGAARPGGVAEVIESRGSITLNFIDADVRDVIRTVLGGTLGLSYALDPEVRGTVTLQTARPIPREATLSTLENVLKLNGLALVRTGEIYRVTPSRAVAARTVRPRLGKNPSGPGEAYGIRIVPLRYASAAGMAKILEPLVAPEAVLSVDPARNLLIIAGTRSEQQTMLEIVDIFDVDWMQGMSFAMLPLDVAKPDEVIADLERVFGKDVGGPAEGVVRFFPIERRNAVLVVTSRPDYLETARKWIARLDVGDSDLPQLFVYRIENGRAADLASILGQVFSDSPPPPRTGTLAPGLRPAQISTPRQSPSGTLGATPYRPDGNALVASRVAPDGMAAQAQPTQPSAPSPRTGAAPPSRPAPRSAAAPPPSAPAAGVTALPSANEEVRIIADEVNNALVVLARPRTYRMIEAALRKLDVVPLQVLIEATIAEVTLNDELRYGVEWFFRGQSGSREGGFTLSANEAGTVVSSFPGFSFLFSSGSDVRVVLDALDSVSDLNIISTPQVMVLDNRSAELRVGDQVPILTRTVSTVDSQGTVSSNDIQYRDTGVLLRVTPRVNASGLVTLDIEQEANDVAGTTTGGIDSPTIQQRRIQSSVAVHSGETIALGGLIRENKNNSRSGIPGLKDIPLLGLLFGSTSETARRTELLVLITPRVVRNQEEARAVTDELRRKLRDAASSLEPSGG